MSNALADRVGDELLKKLNLRVVVQRPRWEETGIPRTGCDIYASIDNVKVVGLENGKKCDIALWLDDKMAKAEGVMAQVAEDLANEIIAKSFLTTPNN